MFLAQLDPGETFELEGRQFEVKLLSYSKRVIIAYVLGDDLERQANPDYLSGYVTELISDTRFNREHETPEDIEAQSLL